MKNVESFQMTATKEWGPQSHNLKVLDSANNLDELGSMFPPELSIKSNQPTLISACEILSS